MSDAPDADAQVRAYLKRQLARNPWEMSEAIVNDRAATLRLRPTATATAATSAEERERLRGRLDELRAGAFTEPLPELIERLKQLHLEEFPELQAVAGRLRTILASREVLPRLSTHRHFNADFLDCFKQVLAAPARDTTLLRERVVHSFSKGKLRRRGVRMIRLLEKEAPALCQLERPWLDTLLHRSGGIPGGGAIRKTEGDGGTKWSNLTLVLLFFVAPVVGRFIGSTENRPARDWQAPSRPAPATPSPLPPAPAIAYGENAAYQFRLGGQESGPRFELHGAPPGVKTEFDSIIADYEQAIESPDFRLSRTAAQQRMEIAQDALFDLRDRHPEVVKLRVGPSFAEPGRGTYAPPTANLQDSAPSLFDLRIESGASSPPGGSGRPGYADRVAPRPTTSIAPSHAPMSPSPAPSSSLFSRP